MKAVRNVSKADKNPINIPATPLFIHMLNQILTGIRRIEYPTRNHNDIFKIHIVLLFYAKDTISVFQKTVNSIVCAYLQLRLPEVPEMSLEASSMVGTSAFASIKISNQAFRIDSKPEGAEGINVWNMIIHLRR